jgi:hypothetical protein
MPHFCHNVQQWTHMKTPMFKRCVVACLLFWGTVVHAIEEPTDNVVEQYNDFEVRVYEPYLVAESDAGGRPPDLCAVQRALCAGH